MSSLPTPNPDGKLTLQEAVLLGAADSLFFAKTFFPKTFRQGFAPFHPQLFALLDSPSRYVGVEIFRGAAKTTIARTFCAKRVSYGMNRTGLFVSKAQDHSIRSLRWLKRQVMYNRRWADAFKLRPGGKWTDEEIEIIQGVEEHPITWIATGITGQNRGLNIDDFRPDLIVVDDPNDEENTNTPEQRQKISALFFGALQKSLAPRSEAPNAKMILLQTGLHEHDLINMCHASSAWTTIKQSCFVYDADERPIASAWPQRFPFEELLVEKQQHIDLNLLSVWLREMECKLQNAETCFFREEWLQYWDELPKGMVVVLAIDPASSDSKDADDQAVVVVGFYQGSAFLLEYQNVKGQNPDELIAEVFRLRLKWRPIKVVVESINYQRTLAHYLRKEMQARNIFFTLHEIKGDKRKKTDRIRQALARRASEGRLVCHNTHTVFIDQFKNYPNVVHDDVLDAVALAVEAVDPHTAGDLIEDVEYHVVGGDYEDYYEDHDIITYRGAP